jgi:hypothetical protein
MPTAHTFWQTSLAFNQCFRIQPQAKALALAPSSPRHKDFSPETGFFSRQPAIPQIHSNPTGITVPE